MLLFRPEIQFLQAVTSVRSGHLLGPGLSRLQDRVLQAEAKVLHWIGMFA